MCHVTWIHSYHFPGNNVEEVCPAFFQDMFKTFQTTLLGIPDGSLDTSPNLLGFFRLALSWAFWVFWKVYWTEPFQNYFCNPSAICLRNFQTFKWNLPWALNSMFSQWSFSKEITNWKMLSSSFLIFRYLLLVLKCLFYFGNEFISALLSPSPHFYRKLSSLQAYGNVWSLEHDKSYIFPALKW